MYLRGIEEHFVEHLARGCLDAIRTGLEQVLAAHGEHPRGRPGERSC